MYDIRSWNTIYISYYYIYINVHMRLYNLLCVCQLTKLYDHVCIACYLIQLKIHFCRREKPTTSYLVMLNHFPGLSWRALHALPQPRLLKNAEMGEIQLRELHWEPPTPGAI